MGLIYKKNNKILIKKIIKDVVNFNTFLKSEKNAFLRKFFAVPSVGGKNN